MPNLLERRMPRARKNSTPTGMYGPLGLVPKDEWPDYAAAWRDKTPPERNRLMRLNTPEFRVMYYADLRQRALDSLWVFLSEVLANPVLYEPLHKPLAEWIGGPWDKQKKLLLMARGHVKSNAFNVGYSLWSIARNRNERILIASHMTEDVNKFVSSIGNAITTHERFRCCFPDVVPALASSGRPRKWSEWRIMVERETDYIEPTVQGTTPNKAAAGQHYSKFIPDDIVTHLNVKSETQLDNTQRFKEQCESLLDPGAKELMLGTRYHFEDEYGRILDTAELREVYDTRVIPAVNDPLIVDEYLSGRKTWKREDDEKYLAYPTRFTLAPRDYVSRDGDATKHRKSLPQIKALQGSLTYANQYLLTPRDPSVQDFDVEKIEIVEELPTLAPNQRYDWYQFLDHASERHTQSKTALGTVAIGPRMTCYLVDLMWGTYSTAQVCEELFRWQQMPEKIRPRIVGMGRSAWELQVEQYCRERSKELGIGVPIQLVKTVEQFEDKNDHIRRLVPFVERSKIKILASCPHRQQVIHEFDWFPKSKSKDIVDMLANLSKIALPGREREFLEEARPAPEPVRKTGITMDEALKQLERGGTVRIGAHQVRSNRSGFVRFRK